MGRWRLTGIGLRSLLRRDNVLYLDKVLVYSGVFICQNLLSSTLKIGALHVQKKKIVIVNEL